jgi:hypothetical protein
VWRHPVWRHPRAQRPEGRRLQRLGELRAPWRAAAHAWRRTAPAPSQTGRRTQSGRRPRPVLFVSRETTQAPMLSSTKLRHWAGKWHGYGCRTDLRDATVLMCEVDSDERALRVAVSAAWRCSSPTVCWPHHELLRTQAPRHHVGGERETIAGIRRITPPGRSACFSATEA